MLSPMINRVDELNLCMTPAESQVQLRGHPPQSYFPTLKVSVILAGTVFMKLWAAKWHANTHMNMYIHISMCVYTHTPMHRHGRIREAAKVTETKIFSI